MSPITGIPSMLELCLDLLLSRKPMGTIPASGCLSISFAIIVPASPAPAIRILLLDFAAKGVRCFSRNNLQKNLREPMKKRVRILSSIGIDLGIRNEVYERKFSEDCIREKITTSFMIVIRS